MPNFAKMHSMHKYFFYAVQVALLFGVYFLTARFGLSLAPVSGFATLVWPPTGIALAALFLFGSRLWPGIFAGAFLVNFVLGAPVLVALMTAVGNTAEALLGAYLLKRAGFRPLLERLKDLFSLIFYGGLLSTVVSASLGVSALFLGGVVTPALFGKTWLAWWLGDALGVVLVATLILSFWGAAQPRYLTARSARFLGLLALEVGVSLVIFGNFFPTGGNVLYLITLPLVWIALAFGAREVAAANLVMASVAIWGTFHGFGPFQGGDLSERLLFLQVFIGIISVTKLILNAVVSERREAEEELRRLNEALEKEVGDTRKFQEAVEFAPAYVVITDTEGTILYANQEAAAMTGYAQEELVGQKPSLYGKLMGPEFYKKLWHVIKDERKPFRDEIRNKRKNGEEYLVDSHIRPITDPRGDLKYFVEVQRDITKEREIERLKSDFTILASHQLRTPLSGAKWLIETMKNRSLGPLTKAQENYLDYLYRSNERMIRLVANMLEIMRFESEGPVEERSDISVAKLISDVVAMLEPAIRKKNVVVDIRNETAKGFTVSSYENMLRSIIESFAANAIDYSEDGSSVTLSAKTEGGRLVFSVTDSGIGIPLRERSRIFERFYRASNAKRFKTSGTGLGLSISAALAKKIGAQITFESEEGKGSAFRLFVPTAEEHTVPPPGPIISMKNTA